MMAVKPAVRDAERRFPVRIRIAVLPEELGRRLDQMNAWLDANYGADAWAIAQSGIRGVVNDALTIYFPRSGRSRAHSWPAGAPRRGSSVSGPGRRTDVADRGGSTQDALSGRGVTDIDGSIACPCS